MSDVAHALLGYLGHALVHGTALAVLTALLCATVLRRARPSLHAALWTIVVLKFLVPVGPELPIPLGGALDAGADAGGSLVRDAGGALVPASGAAPAAPSALLPVALLMLYAAVVAWILGRRALGHLRLRRSVARLPRADADLADAVRRAAASLDRRRLPDVRIGEAGPFVIGLLRPMLVIPRWLDGEVRDAALVHELAHLRRRDPLWRTLEVSCRALFFFWPVVGYCCRRLDRAREAACDRWAVEPGPLDRRAYGELLVALAWKRAAPSPAALALFWRRSALESRIDALLERGARARLGPALALGVVAWGAVCLATGARARPPRSASGFECDLAPGIGARILASHPEADTDGDGMLSEREICAHQMRMERRLVDGVVDAELVSRMDPAADADGDGVLSEEEIEQFKERVSVSVGDVSSGPVFDAPVTLEVGGGRSLDIRPRSLEVDVVDAGVRVCAQKKCLARAATAPPGAESRLLIDVAFPGRD